MHKVDIHLDNREAASIATRRRREEERKQRIFNPKLRTAYVDINILQQQIDEKRLLREQEQLREKLYANQAVRNDKLAVLLEERENADKKRVTEQLRDYWLHCQRKEERKEFDLNDPDAIKKQKPLLTPENEHTLGASSLLKFTGEDLNRRARSAAQVEQINNWIKRQMAEKLQAQKAAEKAEHLNFLRTRQFDETACKLAEAEEEARKALNFANRRYNEALARERNNRKEMKKVAEAADDQAEIANSIFGDMLSENPAQANSILGPGRVCVDRFKGLSQVQLDDIQRIRREQIEEKVKLAHQEKCLDEEWNRQVAKASKLSELLERKYEGLRNEERKKLAQENMVLAQKHSALRRDIEHHIYKNEVTEGFFDQFNTTTR
ncbi:Protein Tax-1 [Cichlidogyrus casuarinus]|uniref:Protein Tax-1 n=1 Tax=Cichlidogyrus casuarinus TaxID=1844966 RepID=A0ABD2PW69_9PLAT